MAETVFYQVCEKCNRAFRVKYSLNGYEYIDEPCECEAEFYPLDGPSISEWEEEAKRVRSTNTLKETL